MVAGSEQFGQGPPGPMRRVRKLHPGSRGTPVPGFYSPRCPLTAAPILSLGGPSVDLGGPSVDVAAALDGHRRVVLEEAQVDGPLDGLCA